MSPIAERVVLGLLVAVIGSHLAVGLLGVVACTWHGAICEHVDWRIWFNEPLAAVLGLLGGKALANTKA